MTTQARLDCLCLLILYLVREENVLCLFSTIFLIILLPCAKEAMAIIT